MPTSLVAGHDGKMAAAADGHFFHGRIDGFILMRCDDRRRHMFRDGIIERGGAAQANRMKDIAFR